jgi:ribonucleoside-diphosphate reductase alpha chain
LPTAISNSPRKAPELTVNGQIVLDTRYLRKGETAEGLFWRVASSVAMAEMEYDEDPIYWAEQFYDLMASCKMMPNTPTLFNAGRDRGNLSACFVAPIPDSLDGIIAAVSTQMKTLQWGGGMGLSGSRIRPEGDFIKGVHQKALGPLAVLKLVNEASKAITQNGVRAGANMFELLVTHPDILGFIRAKNKDPQSISHFNISVAATDAFMESVRAGEDYNLVNPRTREVTGSLPAREVFDEIVSGAWKTGDPGLFFIDAANRDNPLLSKFGAIEATNPCLHGDTKVLTSKGPVAIRDLVDQEVSVLTKLETGELVYRRMSEIQKTRSHTPVVKLSMETLEQGEPKTTEIVLTADHCLYLPDGTKLKAKELKSGDHLLSVNRYHIVLSVKAAGSADVYNGSVTESHRFFIETESGAGILVANCGEEPLLPHESCNLAHLNLAKYVTPDLDFDFNEFKQDLTTIVRFLDDVVTVNQFPVPEQREMNLATRRIGVGVMGWHDALIKMGIPYESDEALQKADEIGRMFAARTDYASLELGQSRGPYGVWEADQGLPYRNAWRRTVAPTGTTSIIAGTSGGIEPWFSLAHERKMHDGPVLLELNEALDTALFDQCYSPEQIDEIRDRLLHGEPLSVIGVDWTGGLHDLFKTAPEISPEFHVRMQAAWQKHVDAGISKTINMPETATREDIAAAYMLAWELGCKGITVFRNGCREDEEQVLSHVNGDGPLVRQMELAGEDIKNWPDWMKKASGRDLEAAAKVLRQHSGNGGTPTLAYNQTMPDGALLASGEVSVAKRRRLPDERPAFTHKFRVDDHDGYITVGLYEDGTLGEIFLRVSTQGSTVDGLLDVWATTTSIALQYGVPLRAITAKLKNARFEPAGMTGNKDIPIAHSIVDYVGRWLEKRFPEKEDVLTATTPSSITAEQRVNSNNGYKHNGMSCPDCGGLLITQEGCSQCPQCGYSKC